MVRSPAIISLYAIPLMHAVVDEAKQEAIITHTQAHNHFTALWILSGTTRVSHYQKKHSPTYTYHGHQSSLICFIHLLRSWHPPCSIHAPDSLFPQSLSKFSLPTSRPGTPTSYSIRFFTQSLSSLRNTCPYHRNRFAVVPSLIVVSLSTPYLEFCLAVSRHTSI